MYKPLTVFLQKPASIFGRAVSYFTKSTIAHTFISVGDGFFLEADLFGVRIFDEKEFKKRKIVTAFCPKDNVFDFSVGPRITLLNTTLFLKNKPYDYLLTVSFLFKRLVTLPGAYNCVEAVKYVLDSLHVAHNISGKDRPCDLVKLATLDNWIEIKV